MDSKLELIISPLYGLKCEHVARYFGSMLLIDFGKKSHYISKIDGKKMDSWEWSISIKDCEWWLNQGEKNIVSNANEEKEISEKIKILEAKSILKLKISADYSQSELIFENDLVLRTKTKPSTKDEDWNLKTPDGKYLLVGPQRKYLYISGDSKEIW